MPTPRIHLLAIISAALALPLIGCCPDDPDVEYDENYEGELVGDELAAARDAADSDEDRCKAACEDVSGQSELPSVTACEAVGADGFTDKPWDPDNMSVTIKCTAHFIEPAFCTGRRPLGHREADVTLGSRAAWFAAHAHLERASVAAFTELAAWLQRRGATELRARCLAAAADEVVHADALEALALRDGAEVQPPGADPGPDDLFTVALHNAVEGCVSEAFAALLATWQAEHAADPALRGLFTAISTDELRHGQLAWDLHAWLWDQLTPTEQQVVASAQQRALQALPDIAASNAAMTPRELGWPTPEHAAVLARDFARRLHVDLTIAA